MGDLHVLREEPVFPYFYSKHGKWCLLRQPQQVGSNMYLHSMFMKHNKNIVYPYKPYFSLYTGEFSEVFIKLTC